MERRAVKSYKVGQGGRAREARGEAGGGGEGSVRLHSVNSHCATCQAQRKQNPPTQQAGRDPERRALQGPAADAGARRAPSPSHSEQRPARPASRAAPGACTPVRPHARTSPTSRGRLPWRLAASPEAALNGCRSQSTTPRRGTSSPPAAPRLPRSAAALARSWRERAGAGEEEEEGRGCQRRRPLLRCIRRGGRHCASSADRSARTPETEHSEEGGGGGAAASATLPAECPVEEGKERQRRRRWGRGAPECGPPPPHPHPGTPGAGRGDGASPLGTRDAERP